MPLEFKNFFARLYLGQEVFQVLMIFFFLVNSHINKTDYNRENNMKNKETYINLTFD
jgi:hypothetical protein